MFSIRVVSLDHYISKPVEELYGKEEQNLVKEWQEPVLRIFGSTADGFKSCVHVHGVYPYIYIPYKGGENAERDALLLGAALDEALRTSLNAKVVRFVHKVSLISGVPLYGYHSKHRQFFKIYFYNPFHIRKVFDLLLSGAILGQKFQPHEAHIPYALQFMMDYNIYGMSFVTFSKVKYRRNPENPDCLMGVREEDILSEKVKKMTWSQLEVDAWASDILNRSSQKVVGANPGLEAIWEDEKDRRRAQKRTSQITIQQSQSRPDVKLHPTEIMYKTRLAEKLAEITPEEVTAISEEPMYSYPAEVPEHGNLLEASAIDEGVERLRVRETVDDVSGLIDAEVLTQISESGKEKAGNESEGEMELESESEAEPEDEGEGGVDMTQPLEDDEEVICGAEGNRREPGTSTGDGEDTFWRNMADKIFQLDGAQESSSESEVDAAPSEFAPVRDVSDGSTDLSSAWSANIMSMLSECSDCPTPSATCPTPRNFWFDYSPDYFTTNQDAWTSNKNLAHFSDLTGKNQNCLESGHFPEGSKEIVSSESYNDLFTPNGGDCFPLPSLCSSDSTVSPPSATVPSPASEPVSPDINLDSIFGNINSPPKEKGKLPSLDGKFTESKIIINGKPDNEEQKVLQVLKSFAGRKVPSEDNSGHLTLKQYIKDCKEIVSVDFKNLCNREMIIIEYKSQNKRSLRNKYLIKPLDKFLESWNSAERRASDRREGREVKLVKEFDVDAEKNLRSNYVINVLEKRFSDTSTVQSMSEQVTVKSMEILPDGGDSKDKCYNVNENIISRGEIKMKLIKSRGGNMENNLVGGTLKRRRSEKSRSLDIKSVEAGNEKVVRKPKSKSESTRGMLHGDKKRGKCKKWKIFPEPDTKLINEINSSFEEYFKSIVKRKNFYRKRKKNTTEKITYDEEEEGEEEEMDEGGETSEDEQGKTPPVERPDTDPIQFVTRFLSTFSQMSDMPPLSITIRLGDSRTSVPIKVNLRPPAEKETKHRGRKHGKKGKIENVDGPADDSSSEGSTGGDPHRRQKKAKRSGHYKPLNMIVYGSSGEKGFGRKRKPSGTEAQETTTDARRSRKSVPVQSSRDLFGVCREKPKSWPPRGGQKEKILCGSSVSSKKNLSNFGKSSSCVEVEEVDEGQDSDFIGDSDEDRKRKRAESEDRRIKRKKKSRGITPQRIPQADTEAFSTSDEDVCGKVLPSEPEVQEGKKMGEGVFAPDEEAGKDLGQEASPSPEFQEMKTKKSKFPQPGTSLSPDFFLVEGSTKQLSTQIPLSPLTLSGNSLFSSEKNSQPEAISQTSETLIQSQKETLSNRPCLSSGSLESLEFGSQMRFLGSSNLDEAVSVPSSEGESINWVSGSKVIKPKRNPLSRKEVVETLQRYSLVESEENAPFYGDPLDFPKTVATGFKVLKVENRSLAGLKPFKSSLNISGSEERRQSLGQKAPRWRLVGKDETTITPLMKPPLRHTVLKSLCAEKDEETRKNESENARVKLVKPLSPEQEMDSDDEIEFSLTASILFPEAGNAVPEIAGTDIAEAPSPALDTVVELKEIPPDEIKEVETLSQEKKSGDSSKEEKRGSKEDNSFQIRGVTLSDSYGFTHSVDDMRKVNRNTTYQYMSMLVMEVHLQTRKDLRPDPENDPIRALFYAMTFDSPTRSREVGVIVVGEGFLLGSAPPELSIVHVSTEKALLEKFVALVREWDPEILTGYEIEMQSWGYLVQRGFTLEMNLILLLGRVQFEDFTSKNQRQAQPGDDVDDVPRSVKQMRISGRIVLDGWRLLRHEIALTSYTFENVMYHLSHERHPLLSYEKLSYYWEHPSRRFRHLVVEHFTTRILGFIRILDQLDFISRTSELSRLFGIQFYEVLSRGSQFRVESMMLRLAKPLNYVPASPSVSQRASMRAPASLPLILEPESLFYTDPVIVLDFQSLYPSIIIAYNYCFSTCLGRVEKLGGREPFEFGCTQLQISPEELRSLENDLTISPAGIAFVKSNIRKGVLPAMLEEILDTRLMVKKAMKENRENKALQKVLFARQLGLKLIANVTYGYTAANFSGRMPCIEVGDSVVSKGRETLHRAIQLVKNTPEWGARVVYGDTDSIFVLTPGRSREEAFKIGAEIAEAVTRDNPKPVKLKLEKVYQPSILQTKKRYVGYMFESSDQKKPVFEAKGIETVRRDGCPAVGKILEKALRILFDTRDVSLVKKYTLRQFSKLYQGRVNVQDLIFAKEYRGRRGYRAGACVPALQLAKQWTQYDKRAEPRVKERVPYVVVNGPPGVPLIRLVRSPADLIADPALRINATYYITKAIIPPMQRCFSLLGVDVTSWYAEMPRKHQKMYKRGSTEGQKKSTISQYFAALECVVCSEVTTAPVCQKCEKDPQALAVILKERIRRWERCHDGLTEICRSCCGRPTELDCVSLDCPVLFRRKQAERAEDQREALIEILTKYL